MDEVTSNGNDWTHYDSDKDIKETIDLYFEKLDAFIEANKLVEKPKKEDSKVKDRKPVKKTTKAKSQSTSVKPERRSGGTTADKKSQTSRSIGKENKPKTIKPTPNAQLINSFLDKIQLIRRMVNMDGKEKTKPQILLFINAIQRKITEKKIRKSSPYAKHIQFIQVWLIKLYNGMGNKVKVVISDEKKSKYLNILEEKQIRPSVRLIRRYINLHVQQVERKSVKTRHNAIANAINTGRVKKSDQYYP